MEAIEEAAGWFGRAHHKVEFNDFEWQPVQDDERSFATETAG